jgi:hypothetical protein
MASVRPGSEFAVVPASPTNTVSTGRGGIWFRGRLLQAWTDRQRGQRGRRRASGPPGQSAALLVERGYVEAVRRARDRGLCSMWPLRCRVGVVKSSHPDGRSVGSNLAGASYGGRCQVLRGASATCCAGQRALERAEYLSDSLLGQWRSVLLSQFQMADQSVSRAHVVRADRLDPNVCQS